ncbi:MAG: hypothetical protein LBT38_10025 [Deltaproteobacteria bacterium]|jgi:hypothetical protein|nr:hypothetical protein [Deltaproteobacteria bacterium]
MLTFPQLQRRLNGLLADLDGDLWADILAQVNPPDKIEKPAAIHDLLFRDAKALAGYGPDLRAIMAKTAPQSLTPPELEAFINIRGLYHLLARLPVSLLTIPDYAAHEQLVDLYNGYRQILVEVDAYLTLAKTEPSPAGA